MDHLRKDEAAIWDLINDAFSNMTFPQKRFWEIIRILPEEWSYKPRWPLGGTVWVVAIVGKRVVWYDDFFGEMDDDFCVSEYERYGELAGPMKPVNLSLEKSVETLRLKITDPGFE